MIRLTKTIVVATSLFLSLGSLAQSTRPLCDSQTKEGVPCKNHAQKGSTSCKIHEKNIIRCGAATKTGGKCQNKVKYPGQKCHKHS